MARIDAALHKWGPETMALNSPRGSHLTAPVEHDPLPTSTTAYTRALLDPTPAVTDQLRHRHEPATAGGPQGLLVPYYSASLSGTPTHHAMGTLTTTDRYALVMHNSSRRRELEPHAWKPGPLQAASTEHRSTLQVEIDDCMFRMLEPHEIGAGMAFLPDYVVLGNKRQRVKQYGNAVTPPASEVLMTPLVECIQGHDIDWSVAS